VSDVSLDAGAGDMLSDAPSAFARYEAIRPRLPSAVYPGPLAAPALAGRGGRPRGRLPPGCLRGPERGRDADPRRGGAAQASLRARGKRLAVLTNAASYTREQLLAKYHRLGFDFTADEVVASRDVAVARLDTIAHGATWAAIAAAGDSFADIPARLVDAVADPSALDHRRCHPVPVHRTLDARPAGASCRCAARRPRPLVIANPDLVAPREGGLTLEPGLFGHDVLDRLPLDGALVRQTLPRGLCRRHRPDRPCRRSGWRWSATPCTPMCWAARRRGAAASWSPITACLPGWTPPPSSRPRGSCRTSSWAAWALQDVLSVIGSGRGAQAVELSFGVTGRIAEVAVAPGDRVDAGTVIARLDASAAQLAVDRARLVLEDAERTVARLDQLAQSGTATTLQRQEAELALRTAELELKVAEQTLADHLLAAPIPGFVGLIEPQAGDIVTSSTAITRIEDRSTLVLDFRVPERLASRIGPGDRVTANAVSLPDSAVEGRIIAVDNRVDEVSRTLRVQASIANPDDRLRAGMAFRIDLSFTGAEHPVVDPLSIQWGSDGAYVWVVREDKATRLTVRIVQRNADFVLVDGDFLPDDLVVTEGVNLLRPGAPVTVTPPRS
jgi:RND family efflux transporter MFP subunit